MKPQRPRTERRRKQRAVAKELNRQLKRRVHVATFGSLKTYETACEPDADLTALDEWAGPAAVAKAQRYEQGETHGQEED